MRISRTDFRISLTLLAVTFALYSGVRRLNFVNYDDFEYVVNNPHLRDGFSARGIVWAFTSADSSNWFPLTWLSYIFDYRIFGLESAGYHLGNLLLHALTSIALFLFLLRATGERWPSAFVAFLFALHPLHVESVAWVAERKDVLCALFWFLTLWAWVRYTERPARQKYLLALLFFALGLMSKPMIVTLPFLLLLLDVWPLRRKYSRQLLREKLPFFALSAVSTVITYFAQRNGGAVQSLTRFPLGLRIENALVTGIVYIAGMFWPSRLAVIYPYPKQLPLWQAVAAALALACISALVLRRFRTRPYLAVGWFRYLGTLVPVIGLVQVGVQSRADRYMYVPMVGLAIMLAWSGAEAVRRWPQARLWIVVPAAAASIALFPVTWLQIRYWKDGETLFRHAMAVTSGNDDACLSLATVLAALPGRTPDAISVLEAGVRTNPHEDRYSRASVCSS